MPVRKLTTVKSYGMLPNMLNLSHNRVRKLIIAGLSFWLPVVLFASLADDVREGESLPGDTALLELIHRTVSSDFSNFFLFFTDLGSALGIILLTTAVAALCLYKKSRTSAAIMIFSVAGAALANFVIKLLFKRDRPSLWESIVTEHSFSFPSGHAMASSAFAFALIAICWRTRWRWLAVILGVSFMVLVGFSRLYFGVHYPSDVIAGWLVSFAWVAIVIAILNTSLLKQLRHKFAHPIESKD